MKRLVTVFALMMVTGGSSLRADLVVGGQATLQFDTASSMFFLLTLDRFYGTGNGVDTATGDQIQAGIGGGTSLTSSGLVDLIHTVNGASVTNPVDVPLQRRHRQATNADIDTNNPHSTWSNLDVIGIDGVTRFASGLGPFVLGDFALKYDSTTSVLSINNNFDFLDSQAFRVQNPTFALTANGFTATGDLRIGSALALFGFTPGDDVGFFTLNAITAVPEPSSALLLVCSTVSLAFHRRKAKVI